MRNHPTWTRRPAVASAAAAVAVACLFAAPLSPAAASPATQAAAQSDARQVSYGMETYFSEHEQYPAKLDKATLTEMGVNLTKGNSVKKYKLTGAGSYYRYCVVAKKGGWALYESQAGGITASAPDGKVCKAS